MSPIRAFPCHQTFRKKVRDSIDRWQRHAPRALAQTPRHVVCLKDTSRVYHVACLILGFGHVVTRHAAKCDVQRNDYDHVGVAHPTPQP